METEYILSLSPETEAAWHLLSPFINPLDCNERYACNEHDDHATYVAMNTTDNLERLFNHEPDAYGTYYRPAFFGKRRLELHRLGGETYGYRSKYNGIARIGFGQSDEVAKAIPYASEIGISGKVTKFPSVGIMLLGVDIDAHHREPDVEQVRDWLLDEYFPGAYAEPSTKGKGCHIYLRCAYPAGWKGDVHRTMQHIHRVIGTLSDRLQERHKELGFRAPIDGIRCAPSLVSWDRSSHKIKIKRSHCLKIPKFINGLADLVAFANSPFFLLPAWDKEQDQAVSDMAGLGEDDDAGHRLEAVFNTDWEDDIQEDDGVYITVRSGDFEDAVKCLSREPDGFQRKLGFTLAYSRHVGQVVSGTELNDAYKNAGLAHSNDDVRRTRRFTGLAAYVGRTFDRSQLGLSLDGWEQGKQATIFRMRVLLGDDYLLYRIKDRGKTFVYELTIEELAAIFWYVGHDHRQGAGGFYLGACSYKQVQRAYQRLLGKSCPRHKAHQILRTLEYLGVIEKTGAAVPGRRGSTYRPVGGDYDAADDVCTLPALVG